MNKSIRKSFVFGLIFAIFSIFACLGGISFGFSKTADAAVANAIEIRSAEELFNKVTNYNSADASVNYVLTDNIDMTGYVLNATIGNNENPFKGTFDGKGYSIKNLSIDLSNNTSISKNVGLFGLTDGATISNLQITGTTNLTIGDCTSASVGALVGSAKNTTIKYIQNVSSIKLASQVFGQSLIFGGLVGSANSTNISYVINRQSDAMKFEFVGNNGRISSIGGVVGTLSESSLVFGLSKTNINTTIADTFVGTVNLGGIFGTVSGSGFFDDFREYVSVVNIVAENTLTLTNNQPNFDLAKVYAGQVGGQFVSPYPKTLGVSSIYYKKNVSTINAFGQTNGYAFANPTTYDNVLETSMQASEAFLSDISNKWYHSSRWDFDSVWYSNASIVYLQSFMGGFKVELVSNLLNSNIFNIEKDMEESYFYQGTAEIVFSFKDAEDGTNLSHYYTITGLKQGAIENKVTFDFRDGVYSVSSDPDNYAISEKNGIYTVTISNVNKSTAGRYDLSWKANEFKVEASSRLYDENGVFQEGAEPPANLRHVGQTTSSPTLDISVTYGGNSRQIETNKRTASLPYAFEGWYLENENGADIFLTSTSTLEIKFGTGHFTDNRKVYAKYIDDACKINFDIKGEGIAEIILEGREVTGKTETVSKTAPKVTLEISVKEGYTFDVNRFLDMMNMKGEDTTTFCTWTNEENGDKNYYVFNLNMTALKDDFDEEFSMAIDTSKKGGESNNMIWYIVGGVGGAVVLGVVIFLIIFFVKRKGSGGGKMGGYGGGKKSFKGGFY